MKSLLSLISVFVFASVSFAMDSPWETKLPFKSAEIQYEMAGTMKGEKTIYVKDYGKTTAEYSSVKMKMMGFTQEQREIIITTPEWVYTIDLGEQSGTKQANPARYMIQEFNSLSRAEQKKVVKNAETLGASSVAGMGGTIETKNCKILGYTCDKVSAAGTDTYTISGTSLALKSEGSTMGVKISEIATGIDTGSVPESKFKVPSGINVVHDTQADTIMQAHAKETIQALLDGRAPRMPTGASQAGGMPPAPPENVESDSPSMEDAMNQMMKLFGKE